MQIRIKLIEPERVEDAPFIGALISAIDCNFNCHNCFNQHIKELPTYKYSIEEIFKKIKQNPFHEGIILSGLEWTLQPEEMKFLIIEALKNNLKVILYTGMNEEVFKKQFNEIYKLPIYIKFGIYDEKQKINDYEMYGVKLHSKNQYRRKIE